MVMSYVGMAFHIYIYSIMKFQEIYNIIVRSKEISLKSLFVCLYFFFIYV